MLRRPAFRLLQQTCTQNGKALIRSIRLMPTEALSSESDELIIGTNSKPLIHLPSKSHDLVTCKPIGFSPFLDSSLNHHKISRLSGYFKALRSLKQYSDAVIDMERKTLIKKNGENSNYALPEVLPFPDETCNLDDLIRLQALRNMQDAESFHSMGPKDNSDLILWVLREFIFKLWGSHYSGVVHGNLMPQNVSIVNGECMLQSTASDDSLSLEWKAPEQILCNTKTKASDMFTFGCLLYFCITKGFHPFGDTPEQCVQNIMANKMNISRVKDLPDAYHLISLLLNPEPESRPKASYVFFHPFFNDLEQKVQLLYDFYTTPFIDKAELESNIPIFRSPNWRERFFAYLQKHICTMKQPIEDYKDVFGPRGSPTFFPSIFMGVYEVASKSAFPDDWFQYDRFSDDTYALVRDIGCRYTLTY